MTRPAGSLRERKKKRTRDLLFETANRLFLEQGYDRTTVDEIVTAARISQRTFFRYFSTKEAVVFAKHPERLARFRELLDEHGDDAPVEVVRRALLALARDYMAHKDELLREYRIVTASPLLVARDVELDYEFEQAIAGVLQRQADTDAGRAAVLAGAIFGAVRATMETWFSSGCRQDLVALGAEVFDVLAAGIGSPREDTEPSPGPQR